MSALLFIIFSFGGLMMLSLNVALCDRTLLGADVA